MQELSNWNSFYVIVGSSAGALIGLQFVVLTLVAERPHPKTEEASAAFATPSVVHFGVVLLLSAMISAPWQGITPIAVTWGLIGLSGLVYGAIVTRRMRSQSAYKLVLEDWVFHALLPMTSYGMLLFGLFIVRTDPRRALFIVAAATLMFLFVGIRNSWDAITYHVVTKAQKAKAKKDN